jgi:hypothetical protein
MMVETGGAGESWVVTRTLVAPALTNNRSPTSVRPIVLALRLPQLNPKVMLQG